MSGTHVDGLPERGRTMYGPTQIIPSSYEATVNMEGTFKEFPDIAIGQSGAKVPRSGQKCYGVLMRNAGASTVVGGTVVVMEAAYHGRRHNGASGTAKIQVAGVIDPHLPTTGCRVGDLCWVMTKGPCEVLHSAIALSQGERVLCTNDGKVAGIGTPADATAAQNAALNTLGPVKADATDVSTYCVVDLDVRW